MKRLKLRLTTLVLAIALLLFGGLFLLPGTAPGRESLAQVMSTPRPTVAPTSAPRSATSASGGESVKSQLELALVVDKVQAAPGDLLRYKMQVDNVLGHEATNVWLTCDLPAELQVQEVSGGLGEVHRYDARISFEVGRVQPSFDSYVFEVVARVREDAEPGTRLVYRANLTSDQAGGGERSVETVLGGRSASPLARLGALPTTGSGSVPWWLVVGFGVLIVVVALLSTKGRIRPLR